jgi:hypothetical protein
MEGRFHPPAVAIEAGFSGVSGGDRTNFGYAARCDCS